MAVMPQIASNIVDMMILGVRCVSGKLRKGSSRISAAIANTASTIRAIVSLESFICSTHLYSTFTILYRRTQKSKDGAHVQSQKLEAFRAVMQE